MTNKDKLGISLIVIGFLIPFFIYLGFIFSIPIFIFGVILVINGSLSSKKKLLWVLVPIVLFYPTGKIYEQILFYYSDKKKVDLIIPENYKGSIIILNNFNFGQNFEIKNRREQIVIDNNGIAFYPAQLKLGSSSFRVFEKQKNNTLKKINWSHESSDKKTLLTYGFDSFKMTHGNKSIPYQFITVGRNFNEQTNKEQRCELIELLKNGKFETVYNSINKK